MERLREKETDWKGLFKSFFGSSEEIDYENKSEKEVIMQDDSISSEDKAILLDSLSKRDKWAEKLFFHPEKIKKTSKGSNIKKVKGLDSKPSKVGEIEKEEVKDENDLERS